jgi:uncharacterized protein YcbK (DUF882 family)
MGDLTKNFSSKELKCPCCGLFKKNDSLALLLQTIRDAIGRPVIINSGTRCTTHNKEVGGVGNSAHLTGEAADIYVNGISNKQLGDAIKGLYRQAQLPMLEYCYLIKNSSRAVHVGVDKKNRNSVFGF